MLRYGSNITGSTGNGLQAPIFNGENFNFWQIKMKTIFQPHELWNLVEKGVDDPEKKEEDLSVAERKLLKENIVEDARALGIIP